MESIEQMKKRLYDIQAILNIRELSDNCRYWMQVRESRLKLAIMLKEHRKLKS